MSMQQIKLGIVAGLGLFCVGLSVSLNCNNVVTRVREGGLSYLAEINWTTPVSTGPSGWSLTLFFDEDFNGIGVWKGFVAYNGTERWAEIRNRNSSDAQLVRGDKRSMRFRINYGFDMPPPKVVSLRFQDIELCEDDPFNNFYY